MAKDKMPAIADLPPTSGGAFERATDGALLPIEESAERLKPAEPPADAASPIAESGAPETNS